MILNLYKYNNIINDLLTFTTTTTTMTLPSAATAA